MIDFNCDIAQGYGIYQNEGEFELAKYASSINISAGFHAGDSMQIRKAFLFAQDNNIALGAHIGYPDIQGFGKRKMVLDKDELESVILYQIGAIEAYAKTFDLVIEQVRCHGALKDDINSSPDTAQFVAQAIKKINPWLNLIVQNIETKNIIQNAGVKAAYEMDYNSEMSLNDILELQDCPDTIHFRKIEDIKSACEIIKPAPINYNRVQGQI